MATLTLKEPGESAFLTIEAASRLEGEHGTQIQFESDDGNTLVVPLSSVDRQLERLNVEGWRSLIGKTVKFSRSANKIAGRNPYWNLDLADPQKKNGDTPKNEKQSEPTTRTNGHTDSVYKIAKPTLEDLVHSYGECLAASVNQYKPWLIEKGVEVDSQNIVSMASTLFVQRMIRGV
jgi:hypothetical protein